MSFFLPYSAAGTYDPPAPKGKFSQRPEKRHGQTVLFRCSGRTVSVAGVVYGIEKRRAARFVFPFDCRTKANRSVAQCDSGHSQKGILPMFRLPQGKRATEDRSEDKEHKPL